MGMGWVSAHWIHFLSPSFFLKESSSRVLISGRVMITMSGYLSITAFRKTAISLRMGGGIGLNRTHAGVIPKCEFEINPGLLVGEGDLYRHGVVCVVERVVGLAIVHVRLRAATQELNLLNTGEGILHEAQGLGCVGLVLNGPLLCFAVQIGGKAVVQN